MLDLPDSLDRWVVGGAIALVVGLLFTGRFGSDIVFMGALAGLVALGVVSPEQAFAGFASPALATVALLYVVAAGMKQTGAMQMLSEKMLGPRPLSPRAAQARLTLPVAALSAFVNNTPIVAMFMPALHGIARRGGFSASKLFMPLSFASILGGTCTLIGTSTNVIVAGLLITHEVRGPDGEPVRIGMFTLAAVGLPIALAGLGYMLLAGRRLLPGASTPGGEAAAVDARQYMVAMRVTPGSAVAGKSIEAAGLRHLPGLFLSRIDRGDDRLLAPGPGEIIGPEDTLVFVGDLDGVVDLQQIRGLVPVTDDSLATGPRHRNHLTEAVVSTASRAVGLTVRDAGFRTRYGAVVLAVHRRGHRLAGKIGDIRLRPGDTLLLESEPGFADRNRENRDFYLVSEHRRPAALNHRRAWIAFAVLGCLVIAVATGLVPTVVGALLAAGAMILFRCCTGPQARAMVDWSVLITIGAAIGVGSAIQATGLADEAADWLLGVTRAFGPWGPLAAVYLLTVLFTSAMTNNAAAVFVFPIAMSIAQATGTHPLPFAVVVAIAASCEFWTPIGYQTNLMVMGPGGYRWLDYTRFGGPLTLMAGLLCVALAPLFYG